MTMLLECSRGPYHVSHVSGAGGSIDTPTVNTSYDHSYIKNEYLAITRHRPGEIEKSKANAALFAASFDHALIWWADEYSSWWNIIKEKGGDRFFDLSNKLVTTDPEGHLVGPSLPLDPFGFPVLTDDLRARLIKEMEQQRES